MLETLTQIDQALSLTINHFHAPWLDTIMIAISHKLTWIPLYALLCFLLLKKYDTRVFGVLLIMVVINIVLTDQISVAMKFGFELLRPCHNKSIIDILHMPVGCGGKFGFVSSHAANTAGLATLMIWLLRKNWIGIVMIAYAVLNSYSRVYLAKHYVGDVIGGMILGILIGAAVYQLSLYLIKRINSMSS